MKHKYSPADGTEWNHRLYSRLKTKELQFKVQYLAWYYVDYKTLTCVVESIAALLWYEVMTRVQREVLPCNVCRVAGLYCILRGGATLAGLLHKETLNGDEITWVKFQNHLLMFSCSCLKLWRNIHNTSSSINYLPFWRFVYIIFVPVWFRFSNKTTMFSEQ